MDAAAGEGGSAHGVQLRAHHIKKRALKNKTLAVSFNEKDLKDYVTGFHKRKKKRRKEALQQQGEADRRKRIELRKKRKLERESVYGEAPPEADPDAAETDGELEDEQETEPAPSVSGMTVYDNGDMQVTVTTTEIAREEDHPIDKLELPEPHVEKGLSGNTKQKMPVVKRKQVQPKRRSRPKPQSKRDKKKGKKKNNKQL